MEQLLVADSFRVRLRAGTAEVRGFDLHLARFAAGVAQTPDAQHSARGSRTAFEAFMAEAPGLIAAGGEGFPRLEAGLDPGTGELSFGVRIRELPRLGDSVELRSAPSAGLVAPRVKGPNISRLAELNRALGAEALLIDGAGRAVEGATTSLLWWDEGTLCVVASDQRIDSVTERLLLGIAERLGVPSERRSLTATGLAAHEVWAVNALHGIRPVAAVDGTATTAPEKARLRTFLDELDATWRPVHGARAHDT